MLGCSFSMRSSSCSQLSWIGGAAGDAPEAEADLARAGSSAGRPAGVWDGELEGPFAPIGLAGGLAGGPARLAGDGPVAGPGMVPLAGVAPSGLVGAEGAGARGAVEAGPAVGAGLDGDVGGCAGRVGGGAPAGWLTGLGDATGRAGAAAVIAGAVPPAAGRVARTAATSNAKRGWLLSRNVSSVWEKILKSSCNCSVVKVPASAMI